jgi:Mlc titration factor MtfA (ptsG expression regulator)
MLHWFRRQFTRAAKRPEGPQLPEELWFKTLSAYPFLESLDAEARSRLQELSTAFLRNKEFHGAAGLAVTDAMALAVAAQACLPLVWLMPTAEAAAALRWYDDFVGIVLHPGEVVARREVTDEAGVVHHYREALTGEAMDGGPVMLSWSDVANAGTTAEEGYNVVIHEFAHKIDMRDGEIDGCPPLPLGFLGSANSLQARALWLSRLQAEFDRFSDRVAAAQRFEGLVEMPWMDPYAAEAPSEFFAVATEAYFVNPRRLAKESPGLHDLLDNFFRPTGRPA